MVSRYLALLAGVALLAACEAPTTGDESTGGRTGGYDANGRPIDSDIRQELAPNVGDRVFFGYNSSVVTSEGQQTLQRQADWLKSNASVKVVIEGHCDERGTREFNLALGERRATAARNYLTSLGVSASRITTVSYGKERPAEMGSTDSAWSKNRRAVTVIGN